jgi:hypothetical protein
MLNSQGSGLDVPDADPVTDEDLMSSSNTRGHCDVQRLAACLTPYGFQKGVLRSHVIAPSID